jgi:hypothetical protein
MTHTEPYKTILVGGAFQSSHQSSASEHITNANITLVERFKSHWSGIEEQACHLVASIQKIEMPVRVIGHSLEPWSHIALTNLHLQESSHAQS